MVETDASNVAILERLNQNGKPVAFFSKPLNASQKLYPSVEKEAMSIVKAIKHWLHFWARRNLSSLPNRDLLHICSTTTDGQKSKTSKFKTGGWSCLDIVLMLFTDVAH